MNKKLYSLQIKGFIFTSILGVLLHYLFDFTDKSMIVALFSPVNESIWEHLKLIYFPMTIYSLIEIKYLQNEYSIFWCVKLLGVLSSILLTPILYYTLNGAFGTLPDFVNIIIYFASIAFGYWLEAILFINNTIDCKNPHIAKYIVLLISVLFMFFTFLPPQIPLFKDPVTSTYGYYQLQ